MPDVDVSDRMAQLARDLRSRHSAELKLEHVVEVTRELIEACEDVGVSLAGRSGPIRTSVSTGEVPTRSDLLQEQLDEGPCRDAVWDAPVVTVRDLASDGRWPAYAPRAVQELGVRSMVCVRLFTHEDRMGALNLFSSEPGAFTDEELHVVEVIAAHAAVALAAAENIENLERAMDNRTVIGQATGIVMATYDLTDAAAIGLLRRLSSEQNRKLADIARDIVDDRNSMVHHAAGESAAEPG